ncbi:MAG: redox-regulated ATPase YchF [Candidatus ainarchaeum sp.]|nr:redox-regulated ATPase YchF [Candidatus ainarchaeum sp.]MDD5096122.1 redox-regulated ATPase YchF [Candidatus ainarchaeum sp.]
MSLLVGIVGKPNAGKSTFFSSLTMVDAKIAPYPFTTLEPNTGVGYVRKKCPHPEKGGKCSPQDSVCENGTRYVPVKLLDVAGLVPDAHKGRGLGLQFLDDLRTADGFIQVVDGTGRSDLEGNPAQGADPADEVRFLQMELEQWIYSIIEKNWKKVKGRGIAELADVLTGLKVTLPQAEKIANELGLPLERIEWCEAERLSFAKRILENKPMVVAANKVDSGADLKALQRELHGKKVIPCSALYELVLRKAAKAGSIEYWPGDSDFKILKASREQEDALRKIKDYLSSHGGTGVQKALEELVFGGLRMIAAYPVEDEGKWEDRKGNLLPNVHLMEEGGTAIDLAEKVHTDLAKRFIGAIDARTGRRVGKEYVLKDSDIIKILSGR